MWVKIKFIHQIKKKKKYIIKRLKYFVKIYSAILYFMKFSYSTYINMLYKHTTLFWNFSDHGHQDRWIKIKIFIILTN